MTDHKHTHCFLCRSPLRHPFWRGTGGKFEFHICDGCWFGHMTGQQSLAEDLIFESQVSMIQKIEG
jgi:hypothetical protein